MEDGSPNLILIFEKGPLEGQTLEFVPRSKVRIGRIVRGNTVAIKDAGVSTKHLAVDFEAKSGNWTLSDLGSSNGTFLNSVFLDPFTPVELSDGDIIKLGEYTSIKVRVGSKSEAEEGKVRRNPPRRRGRKLGVVDENNELGFREKNVINKEEISEDKNGVENAEGIGNVGRDEVVEKLRPKKGKPAKKVEGILEDENGVEDAEEIGNVEQDEAVVEKLRPKRGRHVKKVEILGDFNDNVAEGKDQNQGPVERLKRVTRNMRKGGNLESKEKEKDGENVSTTRNAVRDGNRENLQEVGNKNTRKVQRGKRNLKEESSVESVEVETVKEVEIMEKLDLEVKEDSLVKELLEEEEGRAVDGMVGKEGRDSVMEGSGALERVSGVKDGNSTELDWEKMTLGDWLDYLEVNLPKQIIDDTEEMILDMRQKAEKFHEFLTQQKNAKRQA